MNITRGRIPTAQKCVLYGPEGIGKSTFASKFPEPVFIDTEGSTNQLDVARFDAPKSWAMLMEEVRYVAERPDVCRTLVIDTADWAEKLCIDSILAERKWDSIEAPGYGKGYVYVKEKFGQLLNALTVVMQKGVNVVLTAHAMMRKFEQPDEMGAYDRWELKLSRQTSPIVKEWADMLLFANYKTLVTKVNGKNKAQGGERVIYTTHNPCWDAKNRFGLPDEIPMSYDAIRFCIENVPAPKKEDAPKEPPKEEAPASEDGPHPVPKMDPDYGLFKSDKSKILPELVQLMEKDKVPEEYLQAAVAKKGYYPADVLIQDYDPDFINGWMISVWDQVVALAKQIENESEAF